MNNITRFQHPLLSYSLFHADRHTGLEPELQIVIVHSHFFKQLLYKTAIKSSNLALLSLNKTLKLSYPFLVF